MIIKNHLDKSLTGSDSSANKPVIVGINVGDEAKTLLPNPKLPKTKTKTTMVSLINPTILLIANLVKKDDNQPNDNY